MTTTPETTAPTPKFTARITLLNGQFFDITCFADWGTFIKIAKADGYVMAEFATIPWSAIASIQRSDITMPAAQLVVAPTAGRA